MQERFVYVKTYERPIGRQCMHCGRPAHVTATRKPTQGPVLEVRYCHEHAVLRGAIKEEVPA